MGRKSNRALWTAKLAESLPGAGSHPVLGGKPTRGGNPVTGGDSLRGKDSALGKSPATAKNSASGKGAVRGLSATAALQRAAEAAYGVRRPFHGVVLGIDPSLRGTGIAVVRFSPPEQPRLLFSTTVQNKPALTPAQCLGNIARAVATAIDTYQPVCVSLEQTVYVQNVKTSLILGSARGAAIAPAAMQGLEVFEYAPMRIKQAVVGTGRASKEQVAGMMRSLLQAGHDLLPADEADAAAAAFCHASTQRI